MMLEHNTYKEAIADVKLSEETGLQMVENAIQRKERHTQKFRVRAVAAMAGILIIAFSANGFCYAQTGMNVWDLFHSMYRNNDSKDMAAMAENFQECGESITYKNMKFTLEYYYFDAINGEAYFSMRTDSLDGIPLDVGAEEEALEWQIDSWINRQSFEAGSWSFGRSKPTINESQTSIQRYYSLIYSYENNGSPTDTLEVAVRIKSGETLEDGITYHEYDPVPIGSIVLQPTGEAKSRYADSSSLDGCTTIKIMGAGISLHFDKYYDLENPDQNPPFQYVKLVMADGTEHYLIYDLPLGWELIQNEASGGSAMEYRTDTGKLITEDLILGSFSCGGGFDGDAESGWRFSFYAAFRSYLDVDDIAAVYVDGVEMPLK